MEDTLAGSFQVESFMWELVRIIGGNGNQIMQDDGDGDEDEDVVLAAALKMSAEGAMGEPQSTTSCLSLPCEFDGGATWLSCCGHALVYHGVIQLYS